MIRRHAWLQKHPTPTAGGGEFHWHPADGDRELRARLVERARALEPPAIVWHRAPDRAAWAQVFAATAPHDQRRYLGLVLTVVDGDVHRDELALPAPAPWPAEVAPAPARDAVDVEDLASIARSLLSGGTVHLGARALHAVPAAAAMLEPLLPACVRAQVRDGVWRAGGPGASRPDVTAELLVAASRAVDARAAWAWQLVCELVASTQRSVDDVVARAQREAPELIARMHAWGRARSVDDAAVEQLADALAMRVLGSLLGDRDPARPIAAARWHALLPAGRRDLLLETCARRCPSLRAIAGRAP